MISQPEQSLSSSEEEVVSEPESWEYVTYAIDVGWYKENQRSLSAVLRSRIRLLGGETLERKLQKRKGQSILDALGKQKAKNPGFIPPDLPLVEAVFRVFLTSGNVPLTPVEVRERLMEWWRETGPYKEVEPHILKRLMDHDRFYGFYRVP